MKQLDTIGWYIATLHDLIGHDKASAVLGQEPGQTVGCVLCRYNRDLATKQDVIDRLGVEARHG